MRSLLVSSLHLVFSSRNQHHELILMGSCDFISGMALKTSFNFGKYSFGHNNKHAFIKVRHSQNLCVIMLEVLC